MQASFNAADEVGWGGTMSLIRERFGRLDLVVVSGAAAPAGGIGDYPFSEWRRVVSVNIEAVFLTLKNCMRLIAEGGRGGAIVVVAPMADGGSDEKAATHAVSSAALVQLAKIASREGAPDNIRVNSVLPGGAETRIWIEAPYGGDPDAARENRPPMFEAIARVTRPLGKTARAPEITRQIAFLLSPAAKTINGAALVVESGGDI
jgi:NAD(P)-dependent dehydrogenase (short-subunit alcohol dehydrogenase family)